MKRSVPAIGGLTPFTTIDFPGKLAAVLFCQGCPWRCTYCHNPDLIPFAGAALAWDEVLDFLRNRRDLLEAVVFSGGEPLAQRALPHAIDTVRALGYAVGLHTAGPSRHRLHAVLGRVDWVGFDVKAPFARYGEVTIVPGERAARMSLIELIDSGVPYEVRTTVGAALDADALLTMAGELAALGVRRWTLQRCSGGRGDALADAALLARLAQNFEALELR